MGRVGCPVPAVQRLAKGADLAMGSWEHHRNVLNLLRF